MDPAEHTKYFILIHGKKSSDTARYSVSRNSKSSNARISSIVTLLSLSLSALSTWAFTRWLTSVSFWERVLGYWSSGRSWKWKSSHLIKKNFQGKTVVPGDLEWVCGLVEELEDLCDVDLAVSNRPLAVDQSEESGHEAQSFRFHQSFVSVSVQLRWLTVNYEKYCDNWSFFTLV